MPLSHVCVWDPQTGYRRITTEEASELFPYGASARSGHFVCELCAQNVVLTARGVNRQHFRHDSANPNKECDERQAYFDPNYGRTIISLNSHVMPLRLVPSGPSFRMELGFFSPPKQQERCEKIRISGDSHRLFEYSFERISQFGTTYLNVGDIPSSVYDIEYVNATPGLEKYWSKKVSGVSASGTLFDGRTGHVLQSGGKAFSGSTYYLLQRQPLYYYFHTDIEVVEKARVQTKTYSTWYLYQIWPKRFSEAAARFFLKYSIFLTEKPTKFYPIWPLYIQDPYFIYHNSDNVYFYLCGDDAVLKAFPIRPNQHSAREGKVFHLHSQGKEQLISVGNSGAQGFLYLIRQSLFQESALPVFHIFDLSGKELTEESYSELPKGKQVTVFPQFDGKAVVKKKGRTIYIYRLSADQSLLIDALTFGTEILFYYGCDCVRTICFEAKTIKKNAQLRDATLARKLSKCTGHTVPVTHRVRALVGKYEGYPQTMQWLRTVIRNGTIPHKALRILSESIPKTERRKNQDG